MAGFASFALHHRRKIVTLLCLGAALSLNACQTIPQRSGAGQAARPPIARTLPPPTVGQAPQQPVSPVTPPALPTPSPAPEAATAEPLPPAQITPPSESQPPLSTVGAARIGVLLPLSGQAAGVGQALLDAATLALFDTKQEGVTLLVRDTEGTAEGAARAAEEVLSEGAELLLGPLFAAEVQAVAPLARVRNINMVAFSTDRQNAGNGTYLMGFAPEQQVERVVAAAREAGKMRFAALVPDNAYGAAIETAYRKAVESTGATLVKIGTYPTDMNDFTKLVRSFSDYDRRRAAAAPNQQVGGRQHVKVEAAPPDFDAILLPEGGTRLRAIAPILSYFDVDPETVKYLGTGQWDQPGLGNEPALLTGWFAAPQPQNYEEFRTRFEAAFGRRPLRIASIAYDATALAAALMAQSKGHHFGREALENPQGFAGYDGIFRFRRDGIVDRGLAVLEVQRRGFGVVSPAPESFQSVGQ